MPHQAYTARGNLAAADAGELIRRGRKCLRKGLITHRQLALLDALLWSARKPGSDTAIASYTALQRLAHVSRETIAVGLRRLRQLGLVEIIKRRVRVPWAGRWASRQLTSAYRFRPSATEFGAATVIRGIKISSPASATATALTGEVKAAQDALERRRLAVESALKAGKPP